LNDVEVLGTLHENLLHHPDRQLRFVSHGTVVAKTFSQLHSDVTLLMGQLRACGLVEHDLVGLMASNSYDWIVADLALLTLQCIPVAIPVDETTTPIATSAVSDRYSLSALLVSRSVPTTSLSSESAYLEDRPISLTRRHREHSPQFPSDVFTVAFSSGTSGTKKGLMLSRTGIENTINVTARAWQLQHDDELLIVMPFSNIQQRWLMYSALHLGAGVVVAPPTELFRALKDTDPTIVLGPPSFFEIVDSRIRATKPHAKLRYHLASALHLLAPTDTWRIRAKLGARWTSMYGSRARLMLVGSAPVPPRIINIFHRLGAPLYEVYGLTEIGWITFNLPSKHRTGTAGMPVDGISIDIGHDDAIIVHTDTPQALGYVYEGTDTEDSVFLGDGTIATGDLGRLDASGFLRLTGRQGNTIVTRSGVKISPEQLEREIEHTSPAARAAVLASGDTLISVIWLPGDEPDYRRDVETAIKRLNNQNPASHHITQTVFRAESELAYGSSLLTQNLKLDRRAVESTILPTQHQPAA
jgi:long-chain acyl-CoA synthetase